MADDLITQAEAARLLGVDRARVATLIARGQLAAVAVPSVVNLVRRADVERMAAAPKRRPGRPKAS